MSQCWLNGLAIIFLSHTYSHVPFTIANRLPVTALGHLAASVASTWRSLLFNPKWQGHWQVTSFDLSVKY